MRKYIVNEWFSSELEHEINCYIHNYPMYKLFSITKINEVGNDMHINDGDSILLVVFELKDK